ncbi:MAG TPA: transposase, partial [Anaeromyxobacteraceae bacterium]|nr:transposase [Anaeromyxobacteraceae bacterium]
MDRKVTYRLYPTPRQEAAMIETLRLHQQLYNAALQQRREAWSRQRVSVGFAAQCRELTALRREDETFAAMNAKSAQVTLKRLDLAFQAFFRRVRKGNAPGFPRFKALERFGGWGYKTHGDGWRLVPGDRGRHGQLRLSGVGLVKMRGKPRNQGEAKTCEITRRHGRWYASVTVECTPERRHGAVAAGLDWGVETLATLALDTGEKIEVENPRHLKCQLAKLAQHQRAAAHKRRGSKNRGKAKARAAALHEKIANRRRDFLHKTTAALVGVLGVIATEVLAVKNMTAAGGAHKKGLNREILSTAPVLFLQMLRAKAEEAGVAWLEVPTRTVKPSQTCSGCGRQEKKTLAQRMH